MQRNIKNLKIGCKFWIEIEGRPLLGNGRYELLKKIQSTNSLKKSADALDISYKTAYNYINKMENRLGEKIIIGKKGGISAGGSTSLTLEGTALIKMYEKARNCFNIPKKAAGVWK